MSDGSLSQDEIDALLQGTDDIMDSSMDGGMSGGGGVMTGDTGLTQGEISAFQDLLNSASQNEGETLGMMMNTTVTISNPRIEIVGIDDLSNQLPQEVVEIKLDFDTGIMGEHAYYLNNDMAQTIAGLMMGQEDVELSEQSLGAISEAIGTMNGNAITTIGTQIKKDIRTSPPVAATKSNNQLTLSPMDQFVKVVYDFNIEGQTPGQLYEIFSVSTVKDMTAGIAPAGGGNMGGGQQNMANQMGGQPMMNQPQNMQMGNQPMMNQPQNTGMQNMGYMPTSQVQNVQFSNFNNPGFDGQQGNINLLMDVTMELTVELGRTKKSIKDILSMGEGTVIELDKLAGEPVDILVNGKLIARGEVVVIDENFGVRVTEIINPLDRIQDLS